MDGIKCTSILRNQLNYEGCIIGLTGYSDIVTEENCLGSGMNKVLSKPISEQQIKTIINEQLKK
jgi:osomolarity two-component system sensor histidine kinase SLN1